MTKPPPITREARDWLWDRIGASTDNWLGELLDKMPLAPSSDLDAVRARFQPKTRGGYEYEIFAERGGQLYGRVLPACEWVPADWLQSGVACHHLSNRYDLLPVSLHAALIAELRGAEDRCYHGGMDNTARLFKRAADALEKQP